VSNFALHLASELLTRCNLPAAHVRHTRDPYAFAVSPALERCTACASMAGMTLQEPEKSRPPSATIADALTAADVFLSALCRGHVQPCYRPGTEAAALGVTAAIPLLSRLGFAATGSPTLAELLELVKIARAEHEGAQSSAAKLLEDVARRDPDVLSRTPASVEPDPLAGKLFAVITSAVMYAVTEAGGLTVRDAEQHRSFLRALGGSMALFALSAEPSGALPRETAREVVLSAFESKFNAHRGQGSVA
jgi:hypothetical protein